MRTDHIIKLLKQIKNNSISIDDAVAKIKDLPYQDLDFAKIDHHRELRSSVPEVIFAKNKTVEQTVSIAKAMYEKSRRFLITKADAQTYEALEIKNIHFNAASGTISCGQAKKKRGLVLIISAGTSDMSAAEEAKETLLFLGSNVKTLYDVGVAGIHRILSHKNLLTEPNAVIVAAGMEGALPSVVGGLTNKPVIALPTSAGYGTSFSGLTALFAMLNSCVPGIVVVNIDNGFGAGCHAHKINCPVKPASKK
ncbi:MAG: nickel pincer cofactor biosynthesis protein LarB [Dissulfurispiraceae bacterium]|jgi:NCAIR mutase (PurE)-related protein|nr:nickel pincer cofactor biosynthesis protein LarB [Dissulfurispiraceae bacterium]